METILEKAKKNAAKTKSKTTRVTPGRKIPKVLPSVQKKNFSLYNDGVKKSQLYKESMTVRADKASKTLESQCKKVSNIVVGQMILFHYYNPKTKDELEYYDATPCVIYFGVYNSKEGKRVIGFNLHYYPAKIRYMLMDKIFNLFKPVFMKYWKEGIDKDIDAFDYQFIMKELDKYNLTFGIRQYIPTLIAATHLITPEWFATALFTEGRFMKETRIHVMEYWKNWKPGPVVKPVAKTTIGKTKTQNKKSNKKSKKQT